MYDDHVYNDICDVCVTLYMYTIVGIWVSTYPRYINLCETNHIFNNIQCRKPTNKHSIVEMIYEIGNTHQC